MKDSEFSGQQNFDIWRLKDGMIHIFQNFDLLIFFI